MHLDLITRSLILAEEENEYRKEHAMTKVFVPTAQTLWISINATLNARLVQNSIYFRYVGGLYGPVPAQAMSDAILAWFKLSVLPNLSEDYVTPVVIAIDLTSISSFVVASFDFSGIHGGMGISIANNVNMRVDFGTGVAGRAYHGWNSVCGLPASVVTRNLINTLWAENIVTAYSLLPAIAAALDFEWVVVSRFEAGAPRVAGITTPITTVSRRDLVVDSQRHRIPGRRF